MTKKCFFLHAGGPKTGTSALQNIFEENSDKLNRIGINYAHKIGINSKYQITSGNGMPLFTLLNGFRVPDPWDNNYKKSANIVAPVIQEVNDDELDSLLLSYFEELPNAICSTEFFSELDSSAWLRLVRAAQRHDITLKVIYYVRDVLPFYGSAYDQTIKRHGQCNTIEEFAEHQTWKHYEALKILQEVIPHGNLHVLSYENVKEKLIQSFFELLGVDNALKLKNKSTRAIVNRSLTEVEREILITLNSSFGNRYSEELSNFLLYANPEFTSSRIYTNKFLERLNDRHASSVSWINDIFFKNEKIVSVIPVVDDQFQLYRKRKDKQLQDKIYRNAIHWSIEKLNNLEQKNLSAVHTQEGLVQTIDSLIIDRDAQKSGLEELTKAYNDLSAEHYKVAAWAQTLNQQVETVGRELAERERLVATLGDEKANQNDRVIDLEAQLTSAQADLSRVASERDDEVGRLNQAVGSRDDTIEELNQQLTTVGSELAEWERLVATLADEKANQNDRVIDLEAQLASALADLSQVGFERDDEVGRLKQDVASRNDEIKRLSRYILKVEYDITLLKESHANDLQKINFRYEQEKAQSQVAHIDKEQSLINTHAEKERIFYEQLVLMQSKEREIDQEWLTRSAEQERLYEREKKDLNKEIVNLQHQLQVFKLEKANYSLTFSERMQSQEREYAERERMLHERLLDAQKELHQYGTDWAERFAAQQNELVKYQENIGALRAQLREQINATKKLATHWELAYAALQIELETIKNPKPSASSPNVPISSLEDLLEYHDEAFVNAAYRTLLRRAPDCEGMTYYVRRLRRGISQLEILDQICRSEEALMIGIELPGLRDTLRRNRWLKLPVVGAILRNLVGLTNRQKLFSIENQLFIFNESIGRRLDQIEEAVTSQLQQQITEQRIQTSTVAALMQRLDYSYSSEYNYSGELIPFEGESILENTRHSFDGRKIEHDYIHASAPAKSDEVTFSILLVSYYCPTRAHAGGLRILDIYSIIRHNIPNAQLDLLTFHRPSIDWSLDDVNNLFDNVYLSTTEELTPNSLRELQAVPSKYDVIDFQFHQSGYQIDGFRALGDKIIFTPMESMAKVAFINFKRDLLNADNSRLLELVSSLRFAAEEVNFVSKADETVCVSRSDAALLRAVTSSRRVHWMDTGVSLFEFADALMADFVYCRAEDRRCNILYIAYFGSETNVIALRWFLDNVHPIVKAQVPGYALTIVGRGDLSAFASYHDESVEFVGEVATLAPYLQNARVGIAPALSGAGFRGKVNQYALFGVPSVTSPVAHKGLAYQNGKNIFIAEASEEFADRCIRLLTDLDLNNCMGQAARELCLANYSWQSKWPVIQRIYNLDPAKKNIRCSLRSQEPENALCSGAAGSQEEAIPGSCATGFFGEADGPNMMLPKVTALVPSYNHGCYIRERIESIINQTYKNIELIVIDDCSDDDSHEIIKILQAQYGFQYIRNEQNSGTPFAAWERICTLADGDCIWICESDDVAEPTFLEKAVSSFAIEPNAVLFYSSSHVINENSAIIGHTDDYFHDTWKENRWDHDFTVSGNDELLQFQIRGQTVPNMSSALTKTSAFKAAFTPFLKRFRLTGDWLFIGNVMRQGRVIYSHDTLSRFRKHEVTSRVRVKSARSQAEFILTKYRMFDDSRQPAEIFASLMESDIIRFLYEPASWLDVTKSLMQISLLDTVKVLELYLLSSNLNSNIFNEFRKRYKHALTINNKS